MTSELIIIEYHHDKHDHDHQSYHDNDDNEQASDNLGSGKHNVSLWEKASQAFKGDSDHHHLVIILS